MLKAVLATVLSMSILSGSAFAQKPPIAIPLERSLKDAAAVFIGRLVSAKAKGGKIYYGLLVDRTIYGNHKSRCLISEGSYKIGVRHVFFTSQTQAGCLATGELLPSALEVVSLSGQDYVKLAESRYIYPNFGERFFVLSSIPTDASRPVTLWTGVGLADFEGFVSRLKAESK